MTELRGLELAQDTVDRIYTGRAALRMLGGNPSLNLEIVMGKRVWANLHINLRQPRIDGAAVRNIARHADDPHLLLIWGIPARMDSAIGETDLRFRSEVVL